MLLRFMKTEIKILLFLLFNYNNKTATKNHIRSFIHIIQFRNYLLADYYRAAHIFVMNLNYYCETVKL